MRPSPAYEFSSDPARIAPEAVHAFLRQSYWAEHRPLALQARIMAHSLNLGAFAGGELVAYARIVTDRGTFAWLCDVFVHPEHRGRGLGQALLAYMDGLPELQNLRRWLLATRDAHGLYARHGWQALANPPIWMERFRPDPQPSHS